MLIAINNDSTLHKTAFTELKKEFHYHSDTNFKFERYKIDLFSEVLKTALKMHRAIPKVGIIN